MSKSNNSPPTPEQIAEHKASAHAQFGNDLANLINASIRVEEPRLIAITLCEILIQLIMACDGRELTFAEAGKIAIGILKIAIKQSKYGVGPNGELFDVKTGREISPGGLKQ